MAYVQAYATTPKLFPSPQVARESQLSTFRPYLSSLFGFCMFSVVASYIDLFG
jgi:hypothetical protein